MKGEKQEEYTDFSNVETMHNYLVPEDLPEGPYGSPRNRHERVENKSSPWQEGQRHYSAFNYEFKSFHQDLQRQDPGSHPIHDDPTQSEQPPYENES